MTFHTTSWVLKHSESKLGARLVLIALSEFAHDDGSKAFPSIETLMERSRLSRTGVKDALKRLVKDEMIAQSGETRSGTKVYTILMGGSDSAARGSDSAARGSDSAARGSDSDPEQINKRSGSGQVRNTSKKPVKLEDEIAGFLDWMAYHVGQASSLGLSMSVPAPATMARTDLHKRFEALAGEGRTLEDMKLASLGLLSSEWHRQEGHTKLITVLRQPEKLQERIDAGRAAQAAEKTSSKYAHLGV